MTKSVEIGFEREQIDIPLDRITPTRIVAKSVRATKKYRQIATTIAEMGLVEPMVVFPGEGARKSYLLLDGHLRLECLQNIGAKTARCIVSRDDEAFTYNKRISRLATVQEHYMIRKAIERGVSEDRIAQVLDVNVARIREKSRLLDGICAEAIETLKDRHVPSGTFKVMARMKPLRQVEMAELMVTTNNFSVSYARGLLMATPAAQLVNPKTKKPVGGVSNEELERMEREMENLHRDMKAVESEYGENVVRLVVANSYVTRLIDNDAVESYLTRHHGELLDELQSISRTLAGESGVMSAAAE